MTVDLVAKSESRNYSELFVHDLNWGAPDHAPISLTLDDGTPLTATNVSSYKGLRVWAVPAFPGTTAEAQMDKAIAKTTTNRLVIFHEPARQAWRWPSRSSRGGGVVSRPARHVHRSGSSDPGFAAKLEAIRLPDDVLLDVNSVLTKVRAAFDVETKNETKRASKLMARMYGAIEKAYPAGYNAKDRDHEISVSLARVLFLLFGDDTEMWATEQFQDFIKDHTARDGSDIGQKINELFKVLDLAPNQRPGVPPELAAFRHVNGGIFAEPIQLPPLNQEFRDAVLEAAAVDWSTISPAIFGSMFQSVRDAQTRRELGEHYTSEENIKKTLEPLFLDGLRAELEDALNRDTDRKKANSLRALWDKLGALRFMDPACGCGNFIIVAYRELRALELEIMLALQDLSGYAQLSVDPTLDLKVTLDHFYGIEIDEWPARIAETAMFLVDRQCDLRMKERFGVAPERLPIERQARIEVGNALQLDWATICPPSENVVLAGNPPFLGKEQRTSAQTDDMRGVWGAAYSGEADFVTSWFAKAADFFDEAKGKWAFVATNSVAQGVSVAPVFGYLSEHGWHIRFAHRTFEWTSDASGRAAVHCVIIGFDRERGGERRLFTYKTVRSEPTEVVADTINAYLVDGPEILVRERRRALSPQLVTDIRFGSMAADNGGLLVSAEEYAQVRATDAVALAHLRRFVGAKELLNNKERWCIWMPEDRPHPDARRSPFLTARIAHVKNFRGNKAKDAGVRAAAATPHRFNRVQQPVDQYLCIPRHIPASYDYYPAARFDPEIISGDANFVLDDPEGFYFAVLSTSVFMIWQKMVGGRIKNDPRFASTITWNTFPLPPMATADRARLCELGRAVLETRARQSDKNLAEHYEPATMAAELRAAHADLDAAVYAVFGLSPAHSSELEVQRALVVEYKRLLES